MSGRSLTYNCLLDQVALVVEWQCWLDQQCGFSAIPLSVNQQVLIR